MCVGRNQAAVGKTSMIVRYVKDQFSDSYNVTVGVEFLVRKIEVGNKTIALQLWDTVVSNHARLATKGSGRL
jgi:GTPase SAR1 family protein